MSYENTPTYCFPKNSIGKHMGSNGEVCPAQRSFIRPPKPSRQNHIGTGAPPRHTRPRSICIAGCHHFAGACSLLSDSQTVFFASPASQYWGSRVSVDSRLRRSPGLIMRPTTLVVRGRRTSFCGTSMRRPLVANRDGRLHSALSAEIVSSNFGSSRFAMALRPASPPPSPNS
jgi:hypothetical protein